MSQARMVDLRVVELLCSRLCHDLVGPVAAINNGIELMRDLGTGTGDEALDLVEQSAGIAARRLKYFRAALGAGSILPDEVSPDILAGLAADGLAGTKVTLDPGNGGIGIDLPREKARILLNLVLPVAEGLPRGGRLAFEPASGEGGLAVIGQGVGAHIGPDLADTIAGRVDVSVLEPRRAHAYLTGAMAAAAGKRILADQPAPDTLRLVLV